MAGYQGGFSSNTWRSRRPGSGSGAGAAAGTASLAEDFNALNKQSVDWSDFGQTNIAADGVLERAQQDADYLEELGKYTNDTAFKIGKMQSQQTRQESSENKNRNIIGNVVKTAATLGAFALMSDERAKNTIENIDDALSVLRQLRPVTYYYNEEYSCNPERLHRGFIAQEYKEVLPSATYYDEDSDRFCIDTHELIALLVRSVQQLELKVGRLEAVNSLAGVK